MLRKLSHRKNTWDFPVFLCLYFSLEIPPLSIRFVETPIVLIAFVNGQENEHLFEEYRNNWIPNQ